VPRNSFFRDGWGKKKEGVAVAQYIAAPEGGKEQVFSAGGEEGRRPTILRSTEREEDVDTLRASSRKRKKKSKIPRIAGAGFARAEEKEGEEGRTTTSSSILSPAGERERRELIVSSARQSFRQKGRGGGR